LTVHMPQTASLIDTLSEGYATINRRPWLVIIPILLNIYLWFGPQLSLAPLINDVNGLVQRMLASDPQQSELRDQYSEFLLSQSQVDMRQPMAVLNYIPFTIYVLGTGAGGSGALGLPFVQASPQLIDGRPAGAVEVVNVAGALLAFTLINTLALPLSVAFLTMLAVVMRGEPVSLGAWLRRAGRALLAMLGCIAALLGIGLVLCLPFLFFTGLLFWVAPILGLLAMTLLWVVAFWIRIYIGFAREAIVMNDYGPLRAIHASFNIVRRNLWSTLGFLSLSLMIAIGCGVIWGLLASRFSTAGLLVAIVGSAYVGSGLLAARMAFFRQRMHLWQAAPASAQPRSQSRQ
jgi:hypothetical protein